MVADKSDRGDVSTFDGIGEIGLEDIEIGRVAQKGCVSAKNNHGGSWVDGKYRADNWAKYRCIHGICKTI